MNVWKLPSSPGGNKHLIHAHRYHSFSAHTLCLYLNSSFFLNDSQRISYIMIKHMNHSPKIQAVNIFSVLHLPFNFVVLFSTYNTACVCVCVFKVPIFPFSFTVCVSAVIFRKSFPVFSSTSYSFTFCLR